MKKIPLTQGKFAIVDDEDYELVSQYKWLLSKQSKNCEYAVITKRPRLRMHRLIMGLVPGDGLIVDHINGNGRDNRRANLRVCTHVENIRNMATKGGSSLFRGVTRRNQKRGTKWIAQIMVNRKQYYLGIFNTPIDAAKAYNTAAKNFFGEFARLNDVA